MEVDEGEVVESRNRSRSRSPRRSRGYERSAHLRKIGRAHKRGRAGRRLSETGEPKTQADSKPIKCTSNSYSPLFRLCVTVV